MSWYYSKNGKQMGPFEIADLKKLYSTGQLAPSDLVWTDGMTRWLAASNIPAINSTPIDPIPVAHTPEKPELNYFAPNVNPPLPVPLKESPSPSFKLSISSLVLGILSFPGFALSPLMGLASIVTGIVAISFIIAYPKKPCEKKTTAIILSLIGMVLGVFGTYPLLSLLLK